jgi:transcriptional regulator with XRE-family HTH domain
MTTIIEEMNKEWENLFKFQRDVRKERNITGSALLRKLNLSKTLLKYLYSDETVPRLYPSFKKKTLGWKLHEGLKSFLKENVSAEIYKNTNSELLEEYFRENRPKFADLGIFSICVDSNGYDLIISSKKDVDCEVVVKLFDDFKNDRNFVAKLILSLKTYKL